MCSGQLDHLHEHGGPANVYLIRWSQTTHLYLAALLTSCERKAQEREVCVLSPRAHAKGVKLTLERLETLQDCSTGEGETQQIAVKAAQNELLSCSLTTWAEHITFTREKSEDCSLWPSPWTAIWEHGDGTKAWPVSARVRVEYRPRYQAASGRAVVFERDVQILAPR